MTGAKLAIEEVSKTFYSPSKSSVVALEAISIYVREGEFVSIIGPSGCGKSTLLDITAGLVGPDKGQVFLDGVSITGRRGFFGYMPQKDVLFPWLTILDNVIVPLMVRRMPKEKAREEVLPLLPSFGLDGFADTYPWALSGGMRQRASFLRTYLCKKDLMLLDEPFGKLDALTRVQMQQWLLEMWEKFKHTVLCVTHDVDEAILLSDRIYVMSARPGKIITEVEVALSRPRKPEIVTDQGFVEIKAHLLHLLKEAAIRKV